jgi:hypothetical protein
MGWPVINMREDPGPVNKQTNPLNMPATMAKETAIN